MRQRRGFALVSALWALALASAIAGVALADARFGVNTAAVRIERMRALWTGRGCASLMRLRIDRYLALEMGPVAWRNLDLVAPPPGCNTKLVAGGTGISLNSATPLALHALLLQLGPEPGVSERVAALLDWRDADHDARPGGAERDWYASRLRPGPRNADFEAVEELKAIRGFEESDDVLRFVSLDAVPISILHAPVEVLASLPGFDASLVEAVVQHRLTARGVPDLAAFVATMPTHIRERLLATDGGWVSSVTLDPMSWTLEVSVAEGSRVMAYVQVLRRDARGVFVTVEELR